MINPRFAAVTVAFSATSAPLYLRVPAVSRPVILIPAKAEPMHRIYVPTYLKIETAIVRSLASIVAQFKSVKGNFA